jgi:hypothetical protein
MHEVIDLSTGIIVIGHGARNIISCIQLGHRVQQAAPGDSMKATLLQYCFEVGGNPEEANRSEFV